MRRRVLLGIVVLVLILWIVSPADASQPGEHHLKLTARSFAFEPAVIRVRRGDRVVLEVESLDVTHGLYVDGYEASAVVEPGRTATVAFVADRAGKFRYRCSVACGSMHPFMIGELIVEPNSLFPGSILLAFLVALGSAALVWLPRRHEAANSSHNPQGPLGPEALRLRAVAAAAVASARVRARARGRIPARSRAITEGWRYELTRADWLKRLLRWRGLQPALMMPLLFAMVLAILTGLWGTPVGGKNFAIVFVWIVWFALLMILMVPFTGRLWCAICPLPAPGEWLQRRGIIRRQGELLSLGLTWPRRLDSMWPQTLAFLGAATFSAPLLTLPKLTGLALLVAVLLSLGLSLIFERRVFCRYLCPVGGFIGLYSLISPLALRIKDERVCRVHRDKECYTGNHDGHGCPWLVRPWHLHRNVACGLCSECFKTCSKDNIALYLRPFGADLLVGDERRLDEAYKALVMLTSAFLYSAIFLGPWAWLKDWANAATVMHRLAYAAAFWALNLVVGPGLFLLSAVASRAWRGLRVSLRQIFVDYAYALIPLGLSAWVVFTISFVFSSGTYAISTISDPFGWGWNLFGTAAYPWRPLLVRVVPYLQLTVLLVGLAFSVRIAARIGQDHSVIGAQSAKGLLPVAAFMTLATSAFLWLFMG